MSTVSELLPYQVMKDQAARDILRAAIEAESGNVTRAARRLGLQRTHLQRLLMRYKLRRVARELRRSARLT